MSPLQYLTYLLMVTSIFFSVKQTLWAMESEFVAYSLRAAQELLIKEPQRSSSADLLTLGGMTKITGLVYDLDSPDLIVIGTKDTQRAPLILDDFVVALRARFIYGKWPTVSITSLEGASKTASPVVLYEGGVENTPFGKDLADASYRLNQLALGLLPTDLPLHWDVQHERLKGLARNTHVRIHTRFWLHPGLPNAIVKDHVVVIRGLPAGVFMEVLAVEIDGKPVENLSSFQDIAGKHFAQGISDHFQDLPKVHSAFSRLQGLNELAALASALEALEPPPDLSFWLKHYRVKQEHTSLDIKALKRHEVSRSPEVGRTYRQQITGGVQLVSTVVQTGAKELTALGFEPSVFTELRDVVLKTRPEPNTLTWKLEDASASNSDATVQLFAEAVTLSENAHYDEALRVYERIAQTAPDVLHRVLLGKAVVLRKKGLVRWGAAVPGKPAWPLGEDFIQESISLLKECVRIQPMFAECHYELGATLYDLGKTAEAIQHYQEALRSSPPFSLAHYGLGLALYKMEKDNEAVAHLQEYLRTDSSSQFTARAREFIEKAAKSSQKLAIYKNAEWRISFKYPEVWTAMTPEEVATKSQGLLKTEGTVVYVVHNRDFDQNVTVRSFPVPKDSLSTEELSHMERLLDQEYPKQFPGYKKLSARVLTIAGVQGLAYVMDTDRLGTPFRQKFVLVVKGGRDFVFTFTAPRESFAEADRSCFQVILDTLDIQ